MTPLTSVIKADRKARNRASGFGKRADSSASTAAHETVFISGKVEEL